MKMFQCFKKAAIIDTTISVPNDTVVSNTYTGTTTTSPSIPVDSNVNIPTTARRSTYATANKALIQFVQKTGLNATATRSIVEILTEEGFDSLSALKTLTSQDLKEMKIKNGHSRVLLPAVAKLKDHINQVNHALIKAPLPLKINKSAIDPRLDSWLKSLPGTMEIYSSELNRCGYDSIESVSLMEKKDIDTIIPEHKSGHRKVFHKAHVQLKKRLMHDQGIDHLGINLDRHITTSGTTTGMILKKVILKKANSMTTRPTGISKASLLALGIRDYKETNGLEENAVLPLPIDTPHLYVLSGRSRVPQHMKRHTGDGEWKRWDSYPQTAERYNYITDTWSRIDIDPCWGAGVACGNQNGKIYSLTGFAWSPKSDGLIEMPLPIGVSGRTWGDTCVVNNVGTNKKGLLFAAGGFGGTSTGNGSTGLMDSMNGLQSSGALSPIPMDRKGRSERKTKGTGLTQVVDVYDVGLNKWYNVNPLRTPRHSLSLTSTTKGGQPNGVIYAVGGSSGGNQSSIGRKATSVVEMYDISKDRWMNTSREMSVPRLGCQAVCTDDGCLYAIGGSNSLSKHLRAVEFYDGRVGRWASLAPMMTGRSFFGSGVLPNGDVMVVGGKRRQSWSTGCEIFDVRKGIWRAAASMSEMRHSVPHTTYSSGVASGRRPRGYSVCMA